MIRKRLLSACMAAMLILNSVLPANAMELPVEPGTEPVQETYAEMTESEDGGGLDVYQEPLTEAAYDTLATEAADDGMGTVPETEALPVEGESESGTETESELADAEEEFNTYILMLPYFDGVSYVYDEDHLDNELSSDEYGILLYEAGEDVTLGIDSELEFDIVEAESGYFFDEAADGVAEFEMPEMDLMVAPEEEDVPVFDEIEANALQGQDAETEADAQTEASEDTQDETQAAVQEPVQDVPVQEEATDDAAAETEQETAAVAAEDAAETEEEADEVITSEPAAVDVMIDDQLWEDEPEKADAEYEELEEKYAGYPESGSTVTAFGENVYFLDTSFNYMEYVPEVEDGVSVEYYSGNINWDAEGTYTITYKASVDDVYAWLIDVPMTLVYDKDLATVYSDSFASLMPNEQSEDWDGIVPNQIGATVDLGELTVVAGEDVSIYEMTLGYDPSVYTIGIVDDGGYDSNTPGDYKVVFGVTSWQNPEFSFNAEGLIHVVGSLADEAGTETVHVKADHLVADVQTADGTAFKASAGQDYCGPAVQWISVSTFKDFGIDPFVTAYVDGREDASLVLDTDRSGNTVLFQINSDVNLDGKAVLLVIDDHVSDQSVTSGGKSGGSAVHEEEPEVMAVSNGTATIAESKKKATIAKSFAGANGGVHLQAPTCTNYNPPGEAYNHGYASLTQTFIDAAKKYIEDNGSTVVSSFPGAIYFHCSSGSNYAGWPSASYLGSLTAKVTLQDTGSNGWYDLATISISLAPNSTGYQSFYGSASIVLQGGGKLKIKKVSASNQFVKTIDSVNLATKFTIYNKKACSDDDEVATVRLKPEDDDVKKVVEIVELPVGKYWLVEESRADGHALLKTKQGPFEITAGNTTEATIENEPFYGKFIIHKQDPDGQPLEGGVYEVKFYFQRRNSPDDPADRTWYLRTGADGNATYDQDHLVSGDSLFYYNKDVGYAVPKGFLYITETQAPDCYMLDTEIHEIVMFPSLDNSGHYSIPEIPTQTVYSTETPIRGKIHIQKCWRSADNMFPLSQKYSFAGAEYTVFKDEACTQAVEVIRVNENGYGESGLLWKGDYWVQETQVPSCGVYQPDPNKYPARVDLNPEGTAVNPVSIVSVEQSNPVTLNFTKSIEDMEGMSEAELQALYGSGVLENATFTLSYMDNENIPFAERTRTVRCDQYGKASVEVYPGAWQIVETTSPAFHKPMDPQVIEVDGKQPAVEFRNVNKLYEAWIQLQKKDAETGNVIIRDHATFQLYKFDNLVEQDWVGPISLLVEGDTDPTDTFTTNKNGYVRFGQALEGGRYKLVEIEPPLGYEVMQEGVEFQITEDRDERNIITVDIPEPSTYGRLSVTKVDGETGEHCGAGYTFNVYVEENILDGSGAVCKDGDGNELVAGTLVDTIVTDENGVATSKDLRYGKYYVQEAGVPGDGHTLNPEKYPFEVSGKANNNEPRNIDMDIANGENHLQLLKKDSHTGDPLAGITFRIKMKGEEDDDSQLYVTDKDGKIDIKGLAPGKYKVQEVKTLPGYNLDDDVIEFTVDEDCLINGKEEYQIEAKNVPNEVHISKKDITNGEPVPGATLRVTDADGNVVDEWVSTDEEHVLWALPAGTYTLTETLPPELYELSSSVQFTVKDSLEVQKAEMLDRPYREVEISKKDVTNGEELPGAHLVLQDEAGNVVDEWDSTTEPHKLPLHSGKYTLTETKPADGYVTAESIGFEVLERGEGDMDIQHVEMFDDVTKVQVSKQDMAGSEEIPGAHLEIHNEAGDLVDEWVSEEEPHYIEKLPIGKYTLTETLAPDGYVTSETVEFEVLDTAEVQSTVMHDDVTKVEVSKQDVTNGSELPGAHLVIKDEDGETVEEWTSTTEPHYIEMLPVGKYTLTEIQAPEGYDIAETVDFEVLDDAEIQHVVMYDSPTPVPVTPAPQTGDDFNVVQLAVILAAAVVLLAAAAVLIVKGRKPKNAKAGEKADAKDEGTDSKE